MGEPARRLIGFRNGVFDTTNGTFNPYRRENWLRTLNSVYYSAPRPGENLADHEPNFYRWLTRAAGNNDNKQERILAALLMVLANRYDWQMFLEVGRSRRKREKRVSLDRHAARWPQNHHLH